MHLAVSCRLVDTRLGVVRHSLWRRGTGGSAILRARNDGVLGGLTLEEVRLSLERDHLHEVEGVRDLVELLISERDEESVGNELDVLSHQRDVHLRGGNDTSNGCQRLGASEGWKECTHSDERDGKGLGEELDLDLDSLPDDLLDDLGVRSSTEV